MYADYFIGGLFEQQGSGGRIHPSAQRHSDLASSHAKIDALNSQEYLVMSF
jgi:hypothetical protein